MAPKKKSPAELRTVDMFTGKTVEESASQEVADVTEAARADFEPMEKRADTIRSRVFEVQEWTTKYFGNPNDGGANEFRMTRKDDMYYLEKLGRSPSGKSFYSYAGIMVPKVDVMPLATVVAAAARELAKESK